MKRKSPVWFGTAIVCLLASFFLGAVPCRAADLAACQNAPAPAPLTVNEAQTLASLEATSPATADTASGQQGMPPPVIAAIVVGGVVVLVLLVVLLSDAGGPGFP